MGTRNDRPNFTVARRFGLFIEQADRLAGRRLVRSGMDTSLAITVGGGQATVSWKRPDDEEFQAFLVDLRPFISDREPVFLNTVYNVIELSVTDVGLRQEARTSRRVFRDVEAGADLRRGDRSPAQIAGAYIDGTFHVDPAAREQSQRPPGFFADMDQWFVNSYCAGVALRVAEVASIVKRALASGAVSEEGVSSPQT
jgi:hypothetical protein